MPSDDAALETLHSPDGRIRVVVDHAAGSRLASLVVAGHELLLDRGRAVGADLGWGSFPMVPFAGRIRDGRFLVGSGARAETVDLPRTLPPHAIHGTVLGRTWTRLGPGRSSSPLGPEWPWAGSVTQTVEVADRSLTLTLEVAAEGPRRPGLPESMPVSAGWHPWFLRRLDGPDGVVDVVLDVPAEAMWHRDADGIPDGTLVTPPPPGPWDDCFTALIGPVTLTWPGLVTLWVDADAEHVVVYDEQDVAVCVEPQTAPPDAHNSNEDLAWVDPGEALVVTSTWAWRVGGDDGPG